MRPAQLFPIIRKAGGYPFEIACVPANAAKLFNRQPEKALETKFKSL